MRKPNVKHTAVAVMIGAASLTGAGFGIANAMTPSTPPAVTQHQAPTPGAVDKPEAGDTPDAPGAVDKPEAGDTPDGPGQN